MPLTLEELKDVRCDPASAPSFHPPSLAFLRSQVQANAMADDIDIVFDKMTMWSKEEAMAYFESGGTTVPVATPTPPPPAPSSLPPAPPPHPKMPKSSDEAFKAWFPVAGRHPASNPKFRIVCFHNAGSAESVYTGRGLRVPTDNAFVKHCAAHGGELLACQLPGRELRRQEPRQRTLRPYCEALFPVLAPLLQEEVPYVIVGHSMGTWMSYEWIKLCAERGIPLPAMWIVSGFPAPDIPEAERPWNKNEKMDEATFQEECRGWNVNEIVFEEPNWKQYSGMMRDDFTLFDSYSFTPPPAHVGPSFAIPMQARVLSKDCRCKKHHLELWKRFTTASFELEEMPGNHLFFYDVPARDEWMKSILKKLPTPFFPEACID
jgi:surfactin synthase thioesterase subunit